MASAIPLPIGFGPAGIFGSGWWNEPMTHQVAPRSIHTPAPRAFCRAELIEKLLLRCHARTFTDVGCGDGHMAERLAKMGLTGEALDASPEAVTLARNRLQSRGVKDVVIRQADLFYAQQPGKTADVVLLLEVLEHLDDDIAALKQLRDFVRENGLLVLSVPAHAKLWDATDEWAGHVRRYERRELEEKLRMTSWQPIVVYNYGFPLINLTRKLRALFYSRLSQESDSASQREATLRSGIHPDGYVSGFGWLWAAYGLIANLVQRPFLRTDLGEGYLVLAEKIPLE